jgi:hypothetical protein
MIILTTLQGKKEEDERAYSYLFVARLVDS